MKKICIFIVAYNAESTLDKVLDRIPDDVKRRVAEVVVFDDESTDRTTDVAESYGKTHPEFNNFRYFRNPHNLGYGGNQKRGYRYCIEKGHDIVVLLHGDGQYAPEELSRLIDPIEKGEADAVFGSRMMVKGAARKGGMPLYKLVGNKILTRFENALLGMHLTEFHSGYRVYSVEALKQIPFERNTDDFHFDTEIIVQFHAKKFRIRELPIPVYYGDEICRVNGMKYAAQVALSVIQYKLHEKGVRHYGKYAITKRYAYKQDKHSSHGQVIGLIPPAGQKILDVGCGPSELAKFIKKNGNEIVGIDKYTSGEIDPSMARVIAMDLDTDFTLDYGREFDFVLFLDLLEHLRNPDAALQKARAYLKPTGKVIISIPNVAHWSVRLGLLFGLFNYGDKGILDKTHLRFFTLKTFRQMVKDANYRIVKLSATPLPLIDTFPIFRWFPFRAIHWIDVILTKLWKTLFGYQFIAVLEDSFNTD